MSNYVYHSSTCLAACWAIFTKIVIHRDNVLSYHVIMMIWLQWDMFSIGSCIWMLGSQLVVLAWEAVDSLG